MDKVTPFDDLTNWRFPRLPALSFQLRVLALLSSDLRLLTSELLPPTPSEGELVETERSSYLQH